MRLYCCRVRRRLVRLALALAVAALTCGSARAATVEVVVVDHLDVESVAPEAAVGLLVPGWGDTVSRAGALAALVSGRVFNPLRVGESPPVIAVLPGGGGAQVQVLVELPPEGSAANDRRYPIAIVGPGWSGLLHSDSTRIPGLVSIADIAPTVLRLEERPVPHGVTGHALRVAPDTGAAATLAQLDRRLDDVRDARLPASISYGAIVVGLAVLGLAGLGLASGAAVLALPAAATASLACALAGSERWWVFAAATAAIALVGARLAVTPVIVGALCLGAIVFQFVGLAWWGQDVSLSLLGPNPDGGGRFFGLSNELETVLVGTAVVAAALLWERFGPVTLMVVGAIGLFTVAPDRLGSSVTGAVVLAAAFAVLSLALNGWGGLLAAAVVGAAAAAILLLVPPPHLAGAGSAGLLDRLELSARLAVDSLQSVLLTFAVGLVPLVGLAFAWPWFRRRAPGPESAALLAVLVGALVSVVLNDSPGAVLSHMACWSLAVLAYGLARSAGNRPESFDRLALGCAALPLPRLPLWRWPWSGRRAGTRPTGRPRRTR